MAKLKRDERVCPFCAETIKASAIRCRFCQSDVTPLPDPEPGPEPKSRFKLQRGPRMEAEAEPAPVVAEPADIPAASSPVSVWAVVESRLTMLLAILVVLAAAGVGTLWWHADHGSSTVAPSGALVGDDARTEVLITAADLTQRTLSYNYKTLANDMEVARARMTPTFRKEYDSTMAQVRANTTKNKIVLQAVAVSSAIISSTEHKAKVLVFVNQTTSAGTGKTQDQQLNRNSLVVTLTRGDGDWDISKLTALG